ncbi:hypothetical protein B1H10_06605 [candidate division KSB1 bacterium 4484_188]|nr:MAG: hypothetical protein B1H10_06605 [candidate division KSB1 bacterium 4484_188]
MRSRFTPPLYRGEELFVSLRSPEGMNEKTRGQMKMSSQPAETYLVGNRVFEVLNSLVWNLDFRNWLLFEI